jgi:putative ATP-binding cassette transporter
MFTTARHAWSRTTTIARPFFRYEARWRASGLFAALVALLLSVNGLNVLNSYIGRDFMTSLEAGAAARFWALALAYAGLFGVVTTVAVFARYLEEWLDLVLRDGLTRFLIGRYLADRAYHRLAGRADIDNPDQRITEDVKTFTVAAVSFALVLLNATLALAGFAGVLWSITPRLLAAAVLYAAFGTAMTVLLGRRLVPLNILQLKREADFRFRLVHVREHSESIALQAAEPWEARRLHQRLRALVDNFRQVIRVNRNLGFFTTGYNYLTQLIPVLVVAPLYFRGDVAFGVVTQAVAAFAFVLGAFSVIVSQFQQLSAFAAAAERLGALVDAVGQAPEPAGPRVTGAADGPRVCYENLTLRTPDADRVLIKGLTLEVPPGHRLLVRGPNGAGKTALVQATAGMWRWGEGRIVRPRPGDVMFLPQKPFLAPGPLREQLCEGAGCRELTDERILSVFQEVQFERILKRVGGLEADRDWPAVLSPGEQELLAFARLLLAEPRFAFLDVGTSGLPDARLRSLYAALSRTETTYVSIGDQPALWDYHDMVLDLEGEGAWTVSPSRAKAVV